MDLRMSSTFSSDIAHAVSRALAKAPLLVQSCYWSRNEPLGRRRQGILGTE